MGLTHTEIAARHRAQAAAEKGIVQDVIRKLDLSASDSLIEIGCGSGNLLIPLSFIVARAVGVDHPDVLESLRDRVPSGSIRTIRGNFLDLDIRERFSRVLIYSVLHCLANEKEVFAFIGKAITLLKPGGRMLVGDIPNVDLKKRFLSTAAGMKFERKWQGKVAVKSSSRTEREVLQKDGEMVTFNDALVLRILAHARVKNCESYLWPQPNELPFGRTREDIIVIRRPA